MAVRKKREKLMTKMHTIQVRCEILRLYDNVYTKHIISIIWSEVSVLDPSKMFMTISNEEQFFNGVGKVASHNSCTKILIFPYLVIRWSLRNTLAFTITCCNLLFPGMIVLRGTLGGTRMILLKIYGTITKSSVQVR